MGRRNPRNSVGLTGRIIADAGTHPVLSHSPSGVPYVRVQIAVDRHGTNGTRYDAPYIVFWRELAVAISTYATAGDTIQVVGELQTRNITDPVSGHVYQFCDLVADEYTNYGQAARRTYADASLGDPEFEASGTPTAPTPQQTAVDQPKPAGTALAAPLSQHQAPASDTKAPTGVATDKEGSAPRRSRRPAGSRSAASQESPVLAGS